MQGKEETKSLAVLIDADNTSARHAQAIFDEIVTLGEANVRRIYGDFTGKQLAGWDKAIQSLAILQHQQRSNTTGKNASDIALVIDAMDLMHKGRLDGFCLVSSDSDFTRLAQRLREEGIVVYGFGEQKTPVAFRNACNRFIYVENLLEAEPEEKKDSARSADTAARKKDMPSKARKLIASAIGEPDDDGWENLGSVGQRIQSAHPDFDPRSYSCANLSTLVEKCGGFDIRKERGAVHIRRKTGSRKGTGSGKATPA
ncbi:MAG: NYN domain-containing protein [Albidovulum sp.]|nr:NYN domain-containing protein [Albidovulum sp.]